MRQYRVWQAAEQEALRQGVLMHGTGAWEVIRTDPNFRQTLCARTGVQLKDKWRNLVKFQHISEADLMRVRAMSAHRGKSGKTKLPAITRPSADELAGAALPHLRPRRVAERSASSASSTALASPRSPGAMQLQAATRPSSGEYTPQAQSQPQCPSATQLMLQRNGPRGDGSQQLFVRPGGAWHAAVGQHGASSASVPGNGPGCYSNHRLLEPSSEDPYVPVVTRTSTTHWPGGGHWPQYPGLTHASPRVSHTGSQEPDTMHWSRYEVFGPAAGAKRKAPLPPTHRALHGMPDAAAWAAAIAPLMQQPPLLQQPPAKRAAPAPRPPVLEPAEIEDGDLLAALKREFELDDWAGLPSSADANLLAVHRAPPGEAPAPMGGRRAPARPLPFAGAQAWPSPGANGSGGAVSAAADAPLRCGRLQQLRPGEHSILHAAPWRSSGGACDGGGGVQAMPDCVAGGRGPYGGSPVATARQGSRRESESAPWASTRSAASIY